MSDTLTITRDDLTRLMLLRSQVERHRRIVTDHAQAFEDAPTVEERETLRPILARDHRVLHGAESALHAAWSQVTGDPEPEGWTGSGWWGEAEDDAYDTVIVPIMRAADQDQP